MSIRIRFSRFLLRLGGFIQTLPIVVMRPDDLVEFSRQSYAKPQDIDSWSEDSLMDSGLSEKEKTLIASLPSRKGNLLLMGVGGGREAVPLVRMGFEVTGVDYVPEMVERAKVMAKKHNIAIKGLVQEISRLDVPAESYDVVFISKAMYSCVPTRDRRIEMLKRINGALKPGGFFLCQYQRGNTVGYSRAALFLRRLIALFTLGNRDFEDGDMLWLNVEFLHAFPSEAAIQSELEEGGFEIIEHQSYRNSPMCAVVCRKGHEIQEN